MPAEKLEIPLDESLNTCILRDCEAQARSKQLVVFSVLENYYLEESQASVPAVRHIVRHETCEAISRDNKYAVSIVPDAIIDEGLKRDATYDYYVQKNELCPVTRGEVALRILVSHYWEELCAVSRATPALSLELLVKSLEIENWYRGLTSEQQGKLLKYTPSSWLKFDLMASQDKKCQKRYFGDVFSNAVLKDYEFAIFIANTGLQAQGSPADQHFIYNNLIFSHKSIGDYHRTKEYCLSELNEINELGTIFFHNGPPRYISCRDVLLEIVLAHDRDFDEATRLLKLFETRGLLTSEQAAKTSRRIDILSLKNEAQTLLDQNDFERADRTFDLIIGLDRNQAAEVFKTLGNYCSAKKQDKQALFCFQKAIIANPSIGVKNKLKKLSERLGVEIKEPTDEIFHFIQKKEDVSPGWWQKRDLANEYARIGKFDDAMRLFNEALLLRSKSGEGSCDTIYPHMARILEKRGQYEDALLYYLLARGEYLDFMEEKRKRLGLALRRGYGESKFIKKADWPISAPKKYLVQGVTRCLKRLQHGDVDPEGMLGNVPETDDVRVIREFLNQSLSQALFRSCDEFLQSCNEVGRPLFEALFSLAETNDLNVEWGYKRLGFLLRADVDGKGVVICQGYQPQARQSLYTGFADVTKKIRDGPRIVEEFRKKLVDTGVFVAAGPYRELKWVGSRLSDETIDMVVQLFLEFASQVKKQGLAE